MSGDSLPAWTQTVALLGLALTTQACGHEPTPYSKCEAVVARAYPRVMTEPAFPSASRHDANVAVVLSNFYDSSAQVTVRIDGKVAVDELLIGSFGCSHPPVYYRYLTAPPGPAKVTVTTDHGQRTTTRLQVGNRIRWVTAMTQEGFPLYLEVTRIKPAFG